MRGRTIEPAGTACDVNGALRMPNLSNTLLANTITRSFSPTVTLARDPEIKAERFIRPQLGASVMVFLTGALLWYFFHGAYFGSMEMTLALGILAAVAAAGVLGAVVRPATRQLAGADEVTERTLRAVMSKGERVAAFLLVLTVLCMATARMF